MNKKEKILTGVAIALAITTVFILVNRAKKKKQIKEINDILDAKKADPNQEGGQVIIAKTEYDKLPDGRFPLKFGDKNKKVYELQKNLKRNYGLTIDLDGRLGASTAEALCGKIWKTCYTDIQARNYSVSQDDFNKVKNYRASQSFDGQVLPSEQ